MKHDLPPVDWNQIEERIRPHVKFLRDAGYKTTASCGHDMYVSIDCQPMELLALEATLKGGGYRDFEVEYSIHEGFHRWRGATVKFGGDLAGNGKPLDLILLRVLSEAHPLYFVITARRWPHTDEREKAGTIEHDDAYFYDEHTCPTNWTRDIVAVISEGDEDPHGFAKFIQRVPAPEDMDEHGRPEPDGGWGSLFPEIQR